MLFILLTILIIIGMIAFGMLKTWASPTMIATVVFMVSTVLAIFGNTVFWHIELHYKTVLLIVCGLVAMLIGELIASYSNAVVRFKNSPSQTNLKPIVIPMWLNTTIMIFIIISIMYYAYSIRSAGFKSLLEFNVISNKEGGYNFSSLVLLTNRLTLAIGSVYTFIFANNIMYKYKYGGISSYIYKYSITYFFVIIANVLTSSRSIVLSYVYIFILSSLILENRYKKNGLTKNVKRKLIRNVFKVAIMFIVFFLAMGIGMHKFTGGVTESAKNIAKYGGSSIVAFDIWLQKNVGINSSIVKESFNGLFTLLNKFGCNFDVKSQLMPFVSMNGLMTNVYSSFKSFYYDFGINGIIFIPLLIGFIYKRMIIYAIHKNTSYTVMLVCIYVVSSIFSISINNILSSSLTFASIIQVVLVGIVGKFVFSHNCFNDVYMW